MERQVVCWDFWKDGQGRPEKLPREQTPEGGEDVLSAVEEELGFASVNYWGEAWVGDNWHKYV